MTDDEIYNVGWEVSMQNIDDIAAYKLAFARAIIAAHEAKLREGAEVPAPAVRARAWTHTPNGVATPDYYTLDQLQAYGDARALAARDAKSKTCTWSQVDCFDMPGVYDTGCNNAWSFTEGDLSDNKIKYCPFCSGHIDAAMKRGEA